MCHQSVGLVQSVIEKAGIPTVSITLLTEVTKQVAPPRALAVGMPLGYPLGAPNDPDLQKQIMMAAFAMLPLRAESPQLADFEASRSG